MVDGDDEFGIFAANGLTQLAWGVAAAVLIVVSLLPRAGGGRRTGDRRLERDRGAQTSATRSGSVASRDR